MRKIYIAGDSTAASKDSNKKPESGWGEYLNHYLPDFEIINFAKNGRSSKSFFDEGLLNRVDQVIQENDLLLIQFGHNDSKIEDDLRYAPPAMYQIYLKMYIETARKHKAIPVLISSITRRKFENGELDSLALGPYPYAMKELAKIEKVHYIDMFNLSQKLVSELGDESSKKLYLHLQPNIVNNYPNGVIDNTHFSEFGASVFAKIIAESIISLDI